MENFDKPFTLGIVAALSAVRKTLSMYEEGMSPEEVQDMLDELDQQLGLKHIEMELFKRA